MRFSIPRLVLVGMLAIELTNCQMVGKRESDSLVKHAVGDEVSLIYPWMWHEMTFDEYSQLHTGVAILSSDDKLTIRLQYWLDELYADFLKVNPDLSGVVPRPLVVVAAQTYNNAFSAVVPVRYPIPIHITDAAPAAGSENVFAAAITPLVLPTNPANGKFFLRKIPSCTSGEVNCVDAKKHIDDLAKYASWLNESVLPCKFSTGTASLTAALSDCVGGVNPFAPATQADSLVGAATSNFILLGSAIIDLAVQEEEAVAILAHEFSHFTKSHTALMDLTKRFDYPYVENDANRLRKPVADYTKTPGPGVGYYTFEQEADELMVERLARLGIDPAFGAVSMIHFLEFSERTVSTSAQTLNSQQCTAARNLTPRWTDSRGRLVKVPLGPLKDPHHSPCYRAYNMDQQIRVHAFPVKQITRPAFDWAATRQSYLNAIIQVHPIFGTQDPDACPNGAICN